MLDDLIIPSYANYHATEEGSDRLVNRTVKNPERFKSWPGFSYDYNSRGFRDDEWPDDSELASSIWCVGDSFTVGLGKPVDQCWPMVLSRRVNIRTINVSMTQGSNDWISRRSQQIIKEVSPRILIVHWSFINRRERNDPTLPDDQRRIWHKVDLEKLGHSQNDHLQNFIDNVSALESKRGSTKVIHTVAPAYSKEPKVNGSRVETERRISELDLEYFIPEFDILDYARDEFHYYELTTSRFVDSIEKILDLINHDK